jgi:hypothetical protein
MSRFVKRRAELRNGSRATARRAALPRRSAEIRTGTALAPDGTAELAGGVLVETHLLARLLGIRLLRLDGVVTLSPARLVASSADPRAVPLTSTVVPGAGLEHAARLLRQCDRRTSRPVASSPGVTSRPGVR